MTRAARFAVGVLAAAWVSVGSVDAARAFCRTTSCDPNAPEPPCRYGDDGCLVGGLELYWRGRCVTFTVQEDGSPLRGISYDAARATISDAFRQWMFADCGGQRPSLDVIDLGKAVCDEVEYNKSAPNANIWVFRDEDWPYADSGHTLALTTITFNVKTGEIFDADVELNSFDNTLTTSDDPVRADLLSIATHEAGHFLGLSHSTVGQATMFAQYREGDTSLRSLHPDDVAAICSLFSETTSSLCSDEPRHGFSRRCASPAEDTGCVAGQGGGSGALSGAALLGLALLVRGRARRRRPGGA